VFLKILWLEIFMKASNTKPTTTPQAVAFKITIRQRGANAKTISSPKSKKRENIFPKSTDMREMKVTDDSQALFRKCSDFNP
jgi:hypothetical protein